LRNPLTDTPDWRHGVAQAELAREKAGHPVYEPSEDPIVKQLKLFLPLRTGKGLLDPVQLKSHSWSRGYELATKIYEDKAPGGLRDTIEAGLLAADVTMEFFQNHVSKFLDAQTVQLYRDIYYDVQDDKDLQFWVHRNLFVPNKNIINEEKFKTAYMWKVVAYHGGIDFFVKFAIDGIALDEQLLLWIRSMGVSEYVRQVLKSSHSYAKLLDRAGTPVMPMIASWDKTDNDKGDDGNEILIEAGSAIGSAIERPPSDRTGEREDMESQKYEDEE